MYNEKLEEEYAEALDGDLIDPYTTFVSAAGAIDGATDLGEAAAILRAYADWLEEKEYQGWRLRSPIENDFGEVYLIDINGEEVLDATFE